MTHSTTRALAIVIAATSLLAAAGCATVPPWQRGRLADPCMMFDPDAGQTAYMTHWQEAREASSGGYGVQSGGSHHEPGTMFEDIYKEMPWHVREQQPP